MTKLHYLSMLNPNRLDLGNMPKPVRDRLRALPPEDIQLWRSGEWGGRISAPGSPLMLDCAYRVNPLACPKSVLKIPKGINLGRHS